MIDSLPAKTLAMARVGPYEKFSIHRYIAFTWNVFFVFINDDY